MSELEFYSIKGFHFEAADSSRNSSKKEPNKMFKRKTPCLAHFVKSPCKGFGILNII